MIENSFPKMTLSRLNIIVQLHIHRKTINNINLYLMQCIKSAKHTKNLQIPEIIRLLEKYFSI